MSVSNRPPGNPFQPDPLPPGGSEDFLGLGAELGLNAPPGLQPRPGARPAARGPSTSQQVQTGFFPQPGFPQPGFPPQAEIPPQPGPFAAPGRVQPAPLSQTGFFGPQASQRPPAPPPLPSQTPTGWQSQPPLAQTGFQAPLPAPPVTPRVQPWLGQTGFNPPPPAPRPLSPPQVRGPALPQTPTGQPPLQQTGFHAPPPAPRPISPPQMRGPALPPAPTGQPLLPQTGFHAPPPVQRQIPPPQQPFPPSWLVRPEMGKSDFHPQPLPQRPSPHVPMPAQRPVEPAPQPEQQRVQQPLRVPPAPVRPAAPVAMPVQELLPQDRALAPSWPDVRPNNWRVSAPPAGASDPADRASWLLELADGAAPPAHPPFVPRAAPSNASFHDGSVPAEHVAPWFVRGLAILAGLFLCAVIAKTLLLGGSKPPEAPVDPVQPPERAHTAAPVELLTPAEADKLPRTQSAPVNAKRRGQSATPQGAALEAPAELEAPALVVYALPPAPAAQDFDTPVHAPAPAGGLGGPTDGAVRERVERWLTQQSRASSPLVDLGAFRALTPAHAGEQAVSAAATDAGAAVPAVAGNGGNNSGMTGIWEGTTVPIEALDGTLRLETPAVGRVRVRLDGAQREEGRLTAIGQGRVWLTTDAGPIQVESARLRGLEQIAEVEGPTTGPAPTRQRVRTPGGVFYGTVLSREGRSVTLVTDAGARLTVDADEISAAEPVAARAARP